MLRLEQCLGDCDTTCRRCGKLNDVVRPDGHPVLYASDHHGAPGIGYCTDACLEEDNPDLIVLTDDAGDYVVRQ